MALETRAVLASLDPVSDVLTVWSSTQTPCRSPLLATADEVIE